MDSFDSAMQLQPAKRLLCSQLTPRRLRCRVLAVEALPGLQKLHISYGAETYFSEHARRRDAWEALAHLPALEACGDVVPALSSSHGPEMFWLLADRQQSC